MNRKYTNLNDFQNCQIWKLKKIIINNINMLHIVKIVL